MGEEQVCFGMLLFVGAVILLISIFSGERPMIVDLNNALTETENIFTKLYDIELPAHSTFSENRVAVANLANLMSSNVAYDTSKTNTYNNLIQLDSNLNILLMSLGTIYVEGNQFFLTFEKIFSEWEKTIINRYDPKLFELMKNQTISLHSTLSKTKEVIRSIQNSAPSTETDLEIQNKGLSQWINYLNIGLWCNTPIIKKCERELSRVKKITAFLENSDFNLAVIMHHVMTYHDYLGTIIDLLSNEKITVNQVTKNFEPLIHLVKSSHMQFLKNQDITQQYSRPEVNSLDAINVELSVDKFKVYRSKLIGEVGCRGEFITYFTSPPVQRASTAPFLRNIKVSSGSFIDSLTFEWSDNMSFKYGGNGGSVSNFNLNKDELVVGVKVYTHYSGGKVRGLELRTNKWRTSDTFGSSLNPTSLEAPRGYEMVGLYGSYDKNICGIGILFTKIEFD